MNILCKVPIPKLKINWDKEKKIDMTIYIIVKCYKEISTLQKLAFHCKSDIKIRQDL